MSVINTNIQSLVAQNALKVNNRAMSSAMEQLSTGRRINSAKDDAAGLAISDSMSSQIRSLNMAVRNANDGISLAQTAEGAMIEVSNMMQRMRELAVQASTGTLSTEQSEYLDKEFTALRSQIDDTLDRTKWNGKELISTVGITVAIQVGANAGETLDVVSAGISVPAAAGAITDAASASAAIADLTTALDTINNSRAGLGAVINRLTSTADNLTNVSQNLSESRSRVSDADYGAATAELARTMIIQQAGTAVLAQANQAPQSVLALLR